MFNLHVVPSNDVKPKLDLFNTLTTAEDSFMTIINNQVDGLIKTF